MPHEIAEILADPTVFGFIFEVDTVKRDGKSFAGVPLLRVVDLAKFEEAFPGVALASLNGQSVRVASQRIGRDASYEKHAKPEDIQRANVEWLLGIRPNVARVVYAGPDSTSFATEEEAKAAWLEWASNQ